MALPPGRIAPEAAPDAGGPVHVIMPSVSVITLKIHHQDFLGHDGGPAADHR